MHGLHFQSTSGNDYFYDNDTGVIFPGAARHTNEQLTNIPLNPNPFGHKSEVTPELLTGYLIDNAQGFRHLILEVTPQCNLRCKYCVYGEHYPNTRSYNGNLMDISTAQRAVDYYMENYKKVNYRNPNSTPIVGFYGGEPLLNFPVIEATVSYINKKYKPVYGDILYSITTNGVLLDDAKQKFFVENNFALIVSLDGNKENHDRNRVFPDGSGSFDRIYANLERFQKNYPAYQRFAVSACYDYKTDMFRLKEFFDRTGLFAVNVSLVDAHNTTYYQSFTQSEQEQFAGVYREFKHIFLEEAKNNTIKKNSFLFSYVGVYFANFAFRPMIRENRPGFIPYTGACVPGEKLYITGQGDIHICERINHHFPIGNIESGLDYARIAEIVKEYTRHICQDCGSCPFSRFCSNCYAVFAGAKTFTKPKDFCACIGDSVLESLKSYVDVTEIRPDILDEITLDYYQTILEKVGYIVE